MSEVQSTVTKIIEVDVKASKDAAAQIKKMSDSMQELESTAKKTQSATSGMLSMVRGAVGFLIYDAIFQSALNATKAMIAMSDQAIVLNARMKQVTETSSQASLAFGEIVRISQSQGKELDGVAKLYEKIARQSDTLGVTLKGTSQITEGFAAALRLSGANTQESYASMLQFAQALASGKLAGDEFRSILENNAVFMYELAKASGKTIGELKKLATDGGTDLEFLRKAMFAVDKQGETMLDRLKRKAAEIPLTFDQAVNGMKSGFTDLVSSIQWTADQTEGIMTRMIKKITESMGQTAQLVKDAAMIEAAKAKARGENVPPPVKDTNFADRREESLRTQLKDAEKRYMDAVAAEQRRKDAGGVEQKGVRGTLEKNKIANLIGEIEGLSNIIQELENKQLEGMNSPLKPPVGKTTPTKKEKGAAKENWMVDYLVDLNYEIAKAQSEIDGSLSKLDKREIDFYEKVSKKGTGGDPIILKSIIDPENGVLKQLRLMDAAKSAAKFGAENQQFETKKDIEDIKDREEALRDYYKMVKKESPTDALRVQITEVNELILKMTDPEKIAKLEELRLAMFWDIDRLENNTKAYEKAADRIGKAFEGAAENAAGAMLDFMSGTKVSFGNMIADILRGIAKVELELQLKPVMRGIGGYLTSLFDTRQAPNLTTWSDITPSANGNVFGQNGIQYFANGGVVNGPTGFNFAGGTGVMGEAGPEAVMPLKRGSDGKLGVGATPVTVNIINNNGSKVSTTETKNSNGSVRIDVMIEDMVEKGIVGGRFDSAMTASYGVSRRGR